MRSEYILRCSFIDQYYNDGTRCDIGTQRTRSTEVRFFCGKAFSSSQHFIESIIEPATCSYLLKFYTPLLCDHPRFYKKETTFSYIQCKEVMTGSSSRSKLNSFHQESTETDVFEETKTAIHDEL